MYIYSIPPFSCSMEVVKASCDSLKEILATFPGNKVLHQLEKLSHDPHLHWYCFLEPFTGRKKGKVFTYCVVCVCAAVNAYSTVHGHMFSFQGFL